MKKELVEEIARTGGITKVAAGKAYENLVISIAAKLAGGEDVGLGNLGKLKVVSRAARMGRNPKTGEVIEMPAKKTIVFKVGIAGKKLLNG